MGTGSFKRRFWGAAVLGLLALAAYWPALCAGFVWDDDISLTANRLIRAGDGLRRIWFTTEPADYWPVTSSVLWVEWRLWGLHAAGYHAVNLALHLTSALLLWGILRRLAVPGAYLAALMFALHPVNVEAVAWIAQAKSLLALVFFLLAVRAFLASEASAGRRSSGWLRLSLAAFALALLSKGSVAPLPLVLVGLIAWRRPLTAADARRLAPFFALALLLAAVDVWFQRHGAAEAIRTGGPLFRLLGAGAVVWFYLGKVLWPHPLIFVYPAWDLRAGHPLAWAPLLAVLGVTAVLWRGRRGRARPVLFAWGYFLALLVPVMGFADAYFMKYSLVADHYQYPAMIGVVALAATVWAWWSRSPGARRAAVAAAVLAVGACAALTWRQCRDYRETETLLTATLARNPGCWMAHNYLGGLLFPLGRREEAMAHFTAALRIRPDYAEAHFNLGAALAASGRLPEAIAEYRRALALRPGDFATHVELERSLRAAEAAPP